MYPPAPKEALNQSDAVFVGRVISVDFPGGELGGGSVSVTLEVSKYWKGVTSGQVIVTTAENSAACGYVCESADCTAGFKEGYEYLVYASDYNSDGSLNTNICTRTRLLSDAQEDLTALGESYTFSVQNPAGGNKTCDVCGLALPLTVAVIAVVVIVGLVYFKKIRSGKNKK